MRASILLFFLTIAFSLNAQPDKGYMIFQTEGEVSLEHLGTVSQKPDGQQFLTSDVLVIKTGWATLLDQELKRVTIKEDGVISFEEMQGLFRKATASMENKYLVYMWEKMNEKEEHTSKKGGVVRGEQFLIFPYDSAVIIGPEWCFAFVNQENDPVKLLIKDKKHTIIYQVITSDSLFCADSLVSALERPGEYYWTTREKNRPDYEDRMFILPSEADKNQIIKEAEEIRASLKDIPEPERTSVVNEIIRMNKWVY
jgi:hypothetical protein